MGLPLSKGLHPLHEQGSMYSHYRRPAELTRHVITRNKEIQPLSIPARRRLATKLRDDDGVGSVAGCGHDVFVLAIPTATHSEQAPEGL
jgi:hypothetical protein